MEVWDGSGCRVMTYIVGGSESECPCLDLGFGVVLGHDILKLLSRAD